MSHPCSHKNLYLPFYHIKSLSYEPGDHVGVFAMNRTELVDGILGKLSDVNNPDEPLQLQTLNEKHTPIGK